jgi:hypothetical protein
MFSYCFTFLMSMTPTYLTLNENEIFFPYSLYSFMVQYMVFLLENFTITEILILQRVKVHYSLPQKADAIHSC